MSARPRVKVFLALALCGLAHSLQFFEESDNILVINNRKDLASKVLESSSLTLLGAFSEDTEECPGCEKIATEFKKAAKNLAGYGVQTIAVDCTGAIPACHGMTKDLMLTNIPFVRSFVEGPSKNPYTNKWGREGITFDGNADSRSLQKHVLNKIPSILAPRQTADSFPPNDLDGLSMVLLFTERDSPSVLIKALAMHFQGRLTFAEVSDEDEGLKEKFAVSKAPTMLVTFADKEKKDPSMGVVYKGDPKSWTELVDFLEPFALEKSKVKESSKDGVSDKEGKSKKKENTVSKTFAKNAILLNENSFNQVVTESNEAWAVLYHSATQNAIMNADSKYEAWKKAGEKYGSQGPLMKLGEVNCTASASLCSSTLPSSKKPQIVVYDFLGKDHEKGPRAAVETATDIYPLSEALEACESVSQSVTDLTYKMNSGNMDQIAAEAIQQQKSILILASNKEEPPLLLKQLAIDLSAIAVVAFLPSPVQQMMTQFQLDRLPTFVVMYPQGDAEDAKGIQFALAKFDPRMYGKPTFDTVSSFTAQVAHTVNAEAVEAWAQEKQAKLGQAAGGSGGGVSGSGVATLSEVDADSWTKLCDPRSSKLCAIAFMSGGEASPSFNQELETAQAAFNAHANDPYSFMWVNGACQAEFSESFDVQPNQHPTVVVFSPKKSRFAGFIGSYSSDSVKDLLSGVLSGRVKTREMFQLTPPVADRDCSLFTASGETTGGMEAAVESEDAIEEEDMSDMMAEILAEEQKRKAELAAELKAEAEAKKKAEAEKKKEEESAAKSSKKKKKKKSKKKSNEL